MCLIPRGANGVELCGRAAVQYSSHGSFASRAVQASPVWLVDHSSVELHPIIIKRCQSWSHTLLPVSLITPLLLGSQQLRPAARRLHRSLSTDNGHINNNNRGRAELFIFAKQEHFSSEHPQSKRNIAMCYVCWEEWCCVSFLDFNRSSVTLNGRLFYCLEESITFKKDSMKSLVCRTNNCPMTQQLIDFSDPN